MKTYYKAIALAVLLPFLAGCQEDEVKIHAEFTTDKDVYELYEDIYLKNVSYAENARVVASKWEWDGNKMWGLQPESPISFDKVGDYEIKLTATTDIGNVSSTFTKTIKIQDTNVKPVADFTYEPQTGIRAGETEVTFTDKSSDADGSIVSWTWTFGTTTVTEQNPTYTFAEFGDIEVSLTVTDNMRGTNTKTVTLHIDKGAYSLEKAWEQAYDDSEAYVKFSSPAVSPDGSRVYAFSSGYKLAAFDKDGKALWTFDANKHNPSPYTSSGDKRSTSCTPSVDEDGTIFIALAYNERDAKVVGTYESGAYAINPDGSEKWYFAFGNARYISVIPVIIGDQIILTTKANPTKANYPDIWTAYGSLDNGHALNKSTGAFEQTLLVKQGNYGGAVGLKNGTLAVHCNSKFGSRLFFKEDGKWNYYGPNTNQSNKSLGYYNSSTLETGDSSPMAVGKDGKLYILYENATNRVSTKSVLYCYDPAKYVKDASTAFEPEWTVGINGKIQRYDGVGPVIGEDGTIYVTTNTNGDDKARVTAVSAEGSVKWETTADGNITGCAAVDNEGYIYYNDYSLGKLVKLAPADGKKVSEIQLAKELRSSPAISSDGTIYCTGMKDGVPTLFAVKGAATSHADSWSQMGGSPTRSCVLY